MHLLSSTTIVPETSGRLIGEGAERDPDNYGFEPESWTGSGRLGDR
jgi:hypothetical protein